MQNQHYVPQFLLRNFADSDGRIFTYDKINDVVGKVPPKAAASDLGFYEFEVDGQRVSYEDRFQRLETRAAPALRKIVEARAVDLLDASERQRIAEFIAAQSFRTQAFLANIQGQPSRSELANLLERLWQSAFLTVDLISERHWLVMEITHDEVFYLSDQPVVLQKTENPSEGGSLGFDVAGVEAFMPLSPKVAIYMPCRTISDEIVRSHKMGTEMLADLWREGRGASTEAFVVQKALRGTKPFHDAAVLGVAMPCHTESVLNLNYLQCSWSHRWLFSNKRDFATARMVLAKSPQYRQPPTSGVASFFSSTGGVGAGATAAKP